MNIGGDLRSSRLLLNRPAFNFPDPSATWGDVARLVRRVCVLREQGHAAAADTLNAGPLAELVATLRTGAIDQAPIDERLQTIFATEQERVANASALAELLLPMLASSTQPFGAPTAQPIAGSPKTVPVSPEPAAAPVRRAPGNIADFLDDMIAQESSDDSVPPSRRRVS